MQIKIELPPDVFDAQFPEDDFRERVRELAILDLVRVKRLNDQLDQSEAAIYQLARVIEEKDEFRQFHSERWTVRRMTRTRVCASRRSSCHSRR